MVFVGVENSANSFHVPSRQRMGATEEKWDFVDFFSSIRRQIDRCKVQTSGRRRRRNCKSKSTQLGNTFRFLSASASLFLSIFSRFSEKVVAAGNQIRIIWHLHRPNRFVSSKIISARRQTKWISIQSWDSRIFLSQKEKEKNIEKLNNHSDWHIAVPSSSPSSTKTTRTKVIWIHARHTAISGHLNFDMILSSDSIKLWTIPIKISQMVACESMVMSYRINVAEFSCRRFDTIQPKHLKSPKGIDFDCGSERCVCLVYIL